MFKRKTRLAAAAAACLLIAVNLFASAVPALADTAIVPTAASEEIEGVSVDKPAAPPTLWIAGDSTAAAFSDTNYYMPRYGWGTQLDNYLEGLTIRNCAVSGTSSKSYTGQSIYSTMMDEMTEGDYLLIAFGHNDERAESGRYTNPNGSYTSSGSFQYYLYENFVRPAQEKGVTPILVTPIVRRNTGNNYSGESGHITSDQTTSEGTFEGGNYAKAIWQLGVAKSLTVIDLTARTRDVYEKLTASGVMNRHAWASSRQASIDNTHTSLYGAMCNAWFIADELSKSSSSLRYYLKDDLSVPSFTDASINAAYTESSFTAPASLSTKWESSGSWRATVFGDIDGYEYLNDTYFTLQPESDSAMRMAVGVGADDTMRQHLGKIGAATDGIAFYFKAVPSGQNFTLSADVYISWVDANNQASYGLMVRDDVYLDTVINDTMGDYVAAGPLMLGATTKWNCFARKNGALVSGGTAAQVCGAGQTVHMEIRKGTDGYTCVYGDNEAVSAGFDFPLTSVDSDYVYVGMFAARSADVTFTNVSLTYE